MKLRDKQMVSGTDYLTKDGIPIRAYIHIVILAKAYLLSLAKTIKKAQEHPF
jgi:UDP-glucose 4-epimerase